MARIANNAAPGTLFKEPPPARDKKYLAVIRTLPCLVCLREPCGEAAHVRMSTGRNTLARKPSDFRTVSLCHRDHMQQHEEGERQYWERQGIDPVEIARKLREAYPDAELMAAIVRQR